jgi:CRISPR-associated endonuclease/helicase Cas3
MSILRNGFDPLSTEAVREYFAELLWRRSSHDWSALDDVKVGERGLHGIMKATKEGGSRLSFPFADIAAAFQLIKETMVPVIVPCTASLVGGVPTEKLDSLPHLPTAGAVARTVQRHIVQIPRKARQELIKAGSAHALKPDTYGEQFVLLDNTALYTDESGFNWDDPTYRELLLM